ncbi:MAG: hypothetical protein M3Z35_13495 [Nitrospirota bacterium]|nr:hypothetical protein [Nitrospirota bacterium]
MPNPMTDGDKPTQSRSQKPTVSKRSAEPLSQKPAPKKQPLGRSSEKDKAIDNGTQIVITEGEYRALVAQKAHEIFMQRCAITEVDDWIQAERIVKEKLLAQGQTAGFV